MISLVALLLSSVLTAQAAPAACTIVPRAQVKRLFGKLPTEITGYADCTTQNANLQGVLMAKFKRLDDQALEKFVGDLARTLVPDAKRSYVVKKMMDAGGDRQIVVETVRPGGSAPMWHYVFTSRAKNGDVLLYVHTSGAKESRDLRVSLQAVRHELIKNI